MKNDDYLVTWAVGHLLELYDSKDYDESMTTWELEKFPFIPKEFKYKNKPDKNNRSKPDKGLKNQLKLINKLINRKDVQIIISACDNDREGQIIGDIIFRYLRVDKPIHRLLLDEWTPREVLRGLNNLIKNDNMKNLSDAGFCRQWADWVIGINLTSVATLKYKQNSKGVLNIGRVIMPTLKIVYDRDKEIENFRSKKYYKLVGEFLGKNKEPYKGTYYIGRKNKFNKKEQLIKEAKNKSATIINVETQKRRENPPYLFNLSALQRYITSKYKGWTSARVLQVAQSLYEKKYITYPRTVSIALDESLVDRARRVFNTLKTGIPYEDKLKFKTSKRIFDNKKIEGHSAIIPTYIIPSRLTQEEEIIYQAVKNRFLIQFMPSFEFKQTTVTTKLYGMEGVFTTRGRTIIDEGWREVEGGNSKETTIPMLLKGEEVEIDRLEITSHQTKPPLRHTEASLLRVMETAGQVYNKTSEDDIDTDAILSGFRIGTPATSADTIEKIKQIGYVKSSGKSLRTSELGRRLVEEFPVKNLFSLEYTGRLEKSLSDIEKGYISKQDFLESIFNFTRESVNLIKESGGVNQLSNYFEKDIEVLGACPECGENVIENKKAFGCSGWKEGCKFAVWKNDRFLQSMQKRPTKKMVRELLTQGETRVNGLISKKGNKFDAILSYRLNTETGYFNWDMRFPDED